MSYELKDRMSLTLLFNKEEFQFRNANSLQMLHMVASTKLAVPMIHLRLQDNLDSLSSFQNLGDGTLIQVILSSGGTSSSTLSFRLNSSKRSPSDGGYAYDIDGYLDVPVYWNSSASESIRGSSFKALRDIAGICGLGYAGDETADSQIWLPRNRKYHSWTHEISKHGYRSDTSCMLLGLSLDKTLSYRDMNNQRPISKVLKFGQYQSGSCILTDIQPVVSPGYSNNVSTYADSYIVQDVTKTEPQVIDSVTVSKQSSERSLMISSRMKKTIDKSRVRFSPVSCGNNHAEYYRALYQNSRLDRLFSVGLDVVSPENTDLKLLDRVSVILDQSTSYLQTYSGEYAVETRVIHIEGNNYFEKLRLLRRSLNSSVTDSL